MSAGAGLGLGIISAPFISALLLALHRGGRALIRLARRLTRSSR